MESTDDEVNVRMTEQNPKPWRAYEELSRVLLKEWSDAFGLGLESVEGTQKLVGKSGTKWAIDAKGVRAGDSAVVVVECKRWSSSVDQGTVGALAYSIRDVGAAGGILAPRACHTVTPAEPELRQ